MNKTILDLSKDIGQEIDDLVWKYDISYIEACLMYCENKNIEAEHLGDLIKKNQVVTLEIEKEAEKLNFLEKKSRLNG